jgi:hypothetical protein
MKRTYYLDKYNNKKIWEISGRKGEIACKGSGNQ